MATNIDAPFGLRPHNKLGSTPNSNGMTAYKVQVSATAGSSSAIFQGDMVIPLTNGLRCYGRMSIHRSNWKACF